MKWRLVELETHKAYMNMALDEAVSEGVSKGTSPPTIRFYTWKPSAISIGYFQSLADEVDLEQCIDSGVDWVRRRTGGGAVYHDELGEITYSVIAPESAFPKDIIKSYKLICGWIIDGLKELGLRAEFKPINDIVVNGKKISGNAQTRRGGVLLQHGTILYTVDVRRMFSLLKVADAKISDKVIASAEERVTSLSDQCTASREELYEALKKTFSVGKEFEKGGWSAEELTRAKELSNLRYSSAEWNEMR
ncbi:lipoate--protein ligase family protein [Candidatus Micrarchaeota archaeon]|nr:MAG: lipoate--protein ligase family protein [Candidatus Micrarchaeota archaeon]